MGDGYPQMVLTVVTMFIGLFLIVLFAHKKIKGSVLLGMLCASGIYWAGEAIFLHTNPFAALKGASFVPAFGDMAETTLFKFDFAALGEIGWFTVVTLVITFCIIDMFDTIGTLVGTASRAGMVDKDGNMPRMREALLADAVGTVTGACTGTSTVTTFVESASGRGGRRPHGSDRPDDRPALPCEYVPRAHRRHHPRRRDQLRAHLRRPADARRSQEDRL